MTIDWKLLLQKCLPAWPYVAIALAIAGWFATYTYQQRAIGARDVHLQMNAVYIAASRDSLKLSDARAKRSDHAVDSITQLLVRARAIAVRSDSVSHTASSAYRELRDQVLSAPAGSALPSLPQIFASADKAVNACELAKDDCKARADLEQARGDSARAAAAAHATSATIAHAALDTAQKSIDALRHALPSTTGTIVRAGAWASAGAAALIVACWLFHCKP